jgi:predicted ribosome quality control (RQC) complex YloA/Tae2 family protein
MSLDGIFLSSIKNDLYNKLLRGRVDKIYQPDKNEIVIGIRNTGKNYRLLMTAASNSPRIHLTGITNKNPMEPPMFCMVLRKHLTGAHIVDIKQINFDRILEITFECKDELDTTVYKSLIIEIMGKHSNIILINSQTKTIINSIKRVTENMSSVRQVYPGAKYVIPPEHNKLNPLKTTDKIFYDALKKPNEGKLIYNYFYKTFTGLSPFISKEICCLADLNESTYIGELKVEQREKLWDAFKHIFDKVKANDYLFNIYLDENLQQQDFYCIDALHMGYFEKKHYDNPGILLDDYYNELDNKNKINQRTANLIKNINTKIQRDSKKNEKRRNELLNAENREKYKIYGNLIIANINKTPENHKLTVVNYYDPQQNEITIPLDPKLLSLSQNSQKFFKRYNKLKKAEQELKNLINESSNEILYLENILYSIENCKTIDDLDEIYSELVSEGIMKGKSKNKKQKKHKPQFISYISSNGHEILVGRNNIQNDMLTFKTAKKNDYWFHAKNIPGSHVIIRTNVDELKDEEYVEAAQIAAYHSKGKNSGTVEVDYTKKSNVKKPPNSKPGFVIYDTNYSMTVKPDISRIKHQY